MTSSWVCVPYSFQIILSGTFSLRIPTFLVLISTLLDSRLTCFVGFFRIIKVGIGIDNDCKKIMTHLECGVSNWIDLRFLAHEMNQSHLKGFGLAKLSKALLGKELPKAMQLSDWTVDTLSRDQISYAANDALTSLKVFTKYLLLYQQKNNGSLEEFTRRKVTYYCNKKYKLKVSF